MLTGPGNATWELKSFGPLYTPSDQSYQKWMSKTGRYQFFSFDETEEIFPGKETILFSRPGGGWWCDLIILSLWFRRESGFPGLEEEAVKPRSLHPEQNPSYLLPADN